METITYGVVSLKIITTNSVLRENVRTEDNADYLHTRWVIDIVAQVNPAATSYGDADEDGIPIATTSSKPGTTDNAIRQYLMQPRRLLIVQAGTETILQAPTSIDNLGTPLPCDAANGPFCEVFSITRMIGLMHFAVHLRFTACVIESPNTKALFNSSNGGGAILSNRWTANEDIDELGYPTRYFAGEAILRADFMRQQNIINMAANPRTNFFADNLRKNFFFPVPDNYQRQNVKVELSSDGTRLKWSFEDAGKCYNINSKDTPIRKIEAWKNFTVHAGGPDRAAAQQTLQIDPVAFLSGGRQAALSHVANFVQRLAFAKATNLPSYRNHVHVELWGARDASRINLMILALGICFNNAGNQQGIASVGAWEIVVSQCLHEKYVSVDLTISWGEDLNVALNTINAGNGQNLAGNNVSGTNGTVLRNPFLRQRLRLPA